MFEMQIRQAAGHGSVEDREVHAVSALEIKLKREYLKAEAKKWPDRLTPVPVEDWPPSFHTLKRKPTGVMRSRTFLAQFFSGAGAVRMSVCRTAIDDDGNWLEKITWDELQQLKSEAGYGYWWAVEIYPADSEVVNVANMRHLWLLDKKPEYAWGKENPAA